MPRRYLVAIVAVLGTSLLCWGDSRGDRPEDEMMELYGLFVDAVEQVEQNYVRPVSRKELLQSALKGMLRDLDPHSSYFSAEDWKQFRKQIEGSFTGIGISIEIDPESGRLKIIAPLPGSPAYAAGILPGDIIQEVDGNPTEGMTRDKAIEVLQGRPGTPVKLTVLHPGAETPETISVTRAIIELPSVLGDVRKPDDSWDFLLDKDHKIGYVRITSFGEETAEDLEAALRELEQQEMKGLILDLRDDPGGLLSAAVEVSDLFLDDGLIVSTKGRNAADRSFEAEQDGTFDGFPMVVLINGHSASAAEIVAASLQDHDRASIVGQRSFGKGSVQNILPLDDGNSILKLTVAAYMRPSGKNIHRFPDAEESDDWGVRPDEGLEVKMTPEEYKSYFEHRQRRDLVSRLNPVKPDEKPDGEVEGEGGAEAGDQNGDEAAPHARVSEDRQLAKAMEVLKNKLAEKNEQVPAG